MIMIHKLSDFLWANLLKFSPVRRHLAFQMRHRCMGELDLRVPLGNDVCVPWFDQEVGSSFTEIFLDQEYSGLFRFMKPPVRWVDLGAFAGFFSAWVLWTRNRMKMRGPSPEALLIDADENSVPLAPPLFRDTTLYECFLFLL